MIEKSHAICYNCWKINYIKDRKNTMSLYAEYLKEIDERKTQGLNPKPIDGSELVKELIAQIKDTGNEHRKDSLN